MPESELCELRSTLVSEGKITNSQRQECPSFQGRQTLVLSAGWTLTEGGCAGGGGSGFAIWSWGKKRPMVHVHIRYGSMVMKLASSARQESGCLYIIVVPHILSTQIPTIHPPRSWLTVPATAGIMALFTTSSSFPHLWTLKIHFNMINPQYKDWGRAQCELPWWKGKN